MRGRAGLVPVAVAVVVSALLALAHSGEIRERAEDALGRGVPPREAALARGFALGDDQGVDPATAEDFRRAGLSHLLAVSGQNVTLLALLAMPVLAAAGLPLRARLLWVLGLIAVYVPLAGAGPSIQRAAVMGALGLFATLRGRRSSRLYALAVAAAVTLAVSPAIAADVGWQLSLAAVLGILLLAAPLSAWLRRRLSRAGVPGLAVAEGIAMTIAATLSTAPLIAFHFGEVSLVAPVANVLALPAVAPAMWLAMASAAAGQVPGLPVAPLNAVAALPFAYLAQVAAWCGRPSWASVGAHLGVAGLAVSYAALLAMAGGTRVLARRRALGMARRRAAGPRRDGRIARAPLALAVLALALLAAMPAFGGGPPAGRGLRVDFLDVGQGDAILLSPPTAPPILVDGGPPGDGLASKLREEGVGSLAAAVVTHDQSDHAGGVEEILGRLPIGQLVYSALDRRLLSEAAVAGAAPRRVAAGFELRSGRLRVDVIWPPRQLLAERPPGDDPNRLAIVAVARWGPFSALLTADAEAESTPYDSVGPVDVLKVAHHGSDDAGLAALLERTRPRLAVISVGADNPYGHPTPATLATLAAHGVRTRRTDTEGTIELEVRGGRIYE